MLERSKHFLGITSTFRGLMCLAKGHNTAEVGFEPRPLAPESDTLTIRPPRPPRVITDNFISF